MKKIVIALLTLVGCDSAPSVWYFSDPRTMTCFAVVEISGSKSASVVQCTREITETLTHTALSDTGAQHSH